MDKKQRFEHLAVLRSMLIERQQAPVPRERAPGKSRQIREAAALDFALAELYPKFKRERGTDGTEARTQ